jgi:hypothetical protein
MKIIFTDFNEIYFETDTEEMVGCTAEQLVRYLKGVHTNYERFMNRFINVKKNIFLNGYPKGSMPDLDFDIPSLLESCGQEEYDKTGKFFDSLTEIYDNVEPFTFKESFELENRSFQALVFSSIDIPQMINELGAERLKTDGIEVNHRKYDENGNFTGTEAYHNVYETYEIQGEKLGLEESLYAVKCWCTSTNKEHWLWINDEFKDDPLNAIASTFVVHKNIIPHIKAIKRQGDLLLTEMDEDIKPEGELVSLTKEQYFGLLVAQS